LLYRYKQSKVLELHVQAATKLGRGLLVHRGWANFNESMLSDRCDGNSVMFVDFIPQDWLFSQAGAVIHHGGIGTIARALKNDCPMLVEPYGNDQFFNAKRVVGLKVGVAVHPKKITPDGLAKILETKVLTDECKKNTQDLGAKIRAENGLKTACDLIVNYSS
jgi:UDP:flavonoid glycosyltransferase YjiC (YdhE family)